MTADPATAPRRASMARAFPTTGPLIDLAHRELLLAANGTKLQIKALGNPQLLPRPWDPPTCRNAELRKQLWSWIEDVVTWFNTEYVWDVEGTIPSCWPHHPHLVHEIAVLADQRRRAGLALTSDGLEEWHRYCLPAFVDRIRSRCKEFCEEGHQSWPARGRFNRHGSQDARRERQNAYNADVSSREPNVAADPIHARPSLGVVNRETGEITQGPQS